MMTPIRVITYHPYHKGDNDDKGNDGDDEDEMLSELMLSPDVKFRDVSSDYRKLELSW